MREREREERRERGERRESEKKRERDPKKMRFWQIFKQTLFKASALNKLRAFFSSSVYKAKLPLAIYTTGLYSNALFIELGKLG